MDILFSQLCIHLSLPEHLSLTEEEPCCSSSSHHEGSPAWNRVPDALWLQGKENTVSYMSPHALDIWNSSLGPLLS